MATKTILILCFQILFLESIFAQCIGTPACIPEAYGLAGPGIPGPFTSQLTMHIPALPAPAFSIVADDLIVDGIVSVAGSLPFLGTVTLGGSVPAVGEGSVLYNCGNGEVGMVRETPAGRVPIGVY
ncbi:chorion class B protein M2410-like [Vanessa atalanta]|uniref:chorion class B protein M2410-like n=1 Tax=Vanessa atalanta TaxID=42275 RepID=UPI001FCD9E12|nr:chorion class B protein M2410-like [Vanessa atalanta]